MSRALNSQRPNAVVMERTSAPSVDVNAMHHNALRNVQEKIAASKEQNKKKSKAKGKKAEREEESTVPEVSVRELFTAR